MNESKCFKTEFRNDEGTEDKSLTTIQIIEKARNSEKKHRLWLNIYANFELLMDRKELP